MDNFDKELISVAFPADLLQAVKHYALLVRFVEGKELDISDAIINLCRIGLNQESQVIHTKAFIKKYENAEVVEEKVPDSIREKIHRDNNLTNADLEGTYLITEKIDEMTEEDAYKNVKSRGHNITLQSFRQNYSRYGFSRRGDIYIFRRKVKQKL